MELLMQSEHNDDTRMSQTVYSDIYTTAGNGNLNLCHIQRTDAETENIPSSHSKIWDGIVVGFEDFGIVENFISESV